MPDNFQWGDTPQVMVDKVYKMQERLKVLEVYYGDGRFNIAVITIGKEMFSDNATINNLYNVLVKSKSLSKEIILMINQIRDSKPNPDVFKIYLYNRFSIFSRRILGMERNI